MQLGVRPPLSHLVHVHDVARVVGMRVLAHRPHVQHAREDHVGGTEQRHAHDDRPEPPHLILGGHGAPRPRRRRIARPVVVHEGEALSLGVLEVERQPPVALRDRAVRHPLLGEAPLPPGERVGAGDAEVRPRDAARAAPFAGHLPVEEGHVGAGRPHGVGVEEVVRADVVLIDAPLHEPHPEDARVEAVVVADRRRDGGEMMDAGELHGRPDWSKGRRGRIYLFPLHDRSRDRAIAQPARPAANRPLQPSSAARARGARARRIAMSAIFVITHSKWCGVTE